MSSMVFKFLTKERLEVIEALVYFYTGETHKITETEAPEVIGYDNSTGECLWPDFLSWDKNKFSASNYKWFEWYTYEDPGTEGFFTALKCMCKLKNLIVVAGQAHSVTYEYNLVGSSMRRGDDDRVKEYENYNCDNQDLHIQRAVRCSVEQVLKNRTIENLL